MLLEMWIWCLWIKIQLKDHVKFFCTQVIEDFLKTRYEQTSISDQQTVKSFIARCLQLQVIIDLINNSVIDINSKKEAYFLIQII
jgi:hypothetical protein